MRSLAKFTRIFPLLFLLLFACQTEDEPFLENDQEQLEIENFIADAESLFMDPHARIADDQTLCADVMEIPLMHMRYIQVGNVTVANSEDVLYVKYETDPGYFVDKTMLVIVVEKKKKVEGKKLFDKTKYKKYLYSMNHDPGTTSFTYELPVKDLKLKSECISIIAIAKVRESSPINNHRSMYSFARNEQMQRSDRFHGFMIDYCIQDCNVVNLPCDVTCTFGFGVPSVDMSDSYSFKDLKLDDWPWGYVHEINDETTFRLPIKAEDSESGEVVGQVTVMIVSNTAYVYFQLNDGYPMYSSRVYLSGEFPASGVPCAYNFSQDYMDVAGNWKPTLTSTHIIEDVTSLLGTNGNLKIIAYVDFCE